MVSMIGLEQSNPLERVRIVAPIRHGVVISSR
jgi:hypothetical protein